LETYRIPIAFSSRIDAQTAQQLDAFKALGTDSQNNSLVLLTAVNDGANRLANQVDRQNDLIQSLHLDAKQTTHKETETLRQQLAMEGAQNRLQIISSMQNGLDQSTDAMGSQISESTARLLTANSLMQDVMAESITLNRQTVQEDIHRLRENLTMVNLQIARTEAKLDEVILQLSHTRRNGERRNELQHEGNRLTNFLLSLQVLYRELQVSNPTSNAITALCCSNLTPGRDSSRTFLTKPARSSVLSNSRNYSANRPKTRLNQSPSPTSPATLGRGPGGPLAAFRVFQLPLSRYQTQVSI